MKRVTVNIIAEVKNGKPVIENLLVEEIGQNRFRLLRSPGLAAGLAAGDEFELDENEDHGYRLLKRGGNVCLQMFFPHDPENCRKQLEPLVSQLGGRLDGEYAGPRNSNLTYTFPVGAGFPAIEKVASKAMEISPNAEWFYGNVYDVADGVTPLNWWLDD